MFTNWKILVKVYPHLLLTHKLISTYAIYYLKLILPDLLDRFLYDRSEIDGIKSKSGD
ncbi:hypothetical protein NARC_10436 [Candidatus Nitrosocosmicus arcticus]|uniref:Uncharacterized protein n=1 Tax=Candidatus Nitrosocosmicus arcticus TaxID=2035267 RepID=A0A557SZJ3_9ARCH|nr:hypothetical protein NARC_10436 [Candidatus Nitrosocosmicus arcticus]